MKLMKNGFRTAMSLLLCAALFLSVFSGAVCVKAINVFYDGPMVYEYEILPDGTCAITYCRRSKAYQDEPLTEMTYPSEIEGYQVSRIDWGTSISHVTIPQGVTAIGEKAFSGFDLTHITFPESLKEIGANAFEFCDNLTEIRIPGSVDTIGLEAFSLCKSLTKVTICPGVKAIGDEVFQACERLTEVTLPEGLTHIGNRAFQYCSNLQVPTFPSSLTDIGDEAFSCCDSFGILSLPEGVMRIGESAFSDCRNLKKVTIPWTVTEIKSEAFDCCELLTDIVFEGSPPDIAEDAFQIVTAKGYYPDNDPYWQEYITKFTENIHWIPTTVTPDGEVLTGSITTFSGENPKVELLYSSYYTPVVTAGLSVCNGRYRFASVPRGTYVLRISTRNGVTRDYPVEIRWWPITQDLQIKPIGDITGDCVLNIADSAKAYAYSRTTDGILDQYAIRCADINGDGKVNVLDVSKIYSHVKGTKLLW